MQYKCRDKFHYHQMDFAPITSGKSYELDWHCESYFHIRACKVHTLDHRIRIIYPLRINLEFFCVFSYYKNHAATDFLQVKPQTIKPLEVSLGWGGNIFISSAGSAEGSRESSEGWDEVMRGHVEQRRVTANQRETAAATTTTPPSHGSLWNERKQGDETQTPSSLGALHHLRDFLRQRWSGASLRCRPLDRILHQAKVQIIK